MILIINFRAENIDIPRPASVIKACTTGRLAPHLPNELKYTRRCKTLRPTKATNITSRTSIHLRPAKADGRLLFPYRSTLKTITTDNGCEFAAHLEITRLLSMKNKEKVTVYFADSYSSWQKGAIENANKLIRKYIPKKSNFDDFSDRRILEIQQKINRRPREKINFDTPLNRLFQNIT